MRELTLRELQLFCLEILKDVHKFCIENNIKYSLQDGSLIGVVRHKGFIPWDDDVDIVMPRQDYERFCKTYKSDKYEIISPDNDKDCLIAFARVYDSRKTIIRTTEPWCKRKVGVSIDIFPADGAYVDIRKHRRYYTVNRVIWKLSICCRAAMGRDFSFSRPLKQNVVWLISKIIDARFFAKTVSERAAKVPYGTTPYWTQMTCMGDDSKERHSIKTFSNCHLMPFEDTQVMVMEGYDEVLRDKYGNYMQLPPVEKRKLHSSAAKFYWIVAD